MLNEHKEYVSRFYELLKAAKLPVITAADKAGIIIFDEHASDVRKLFAVDTKFTELLETSYTAFDLGGRTVTLFLWPDQGNPITIYIQPITGTANGESVNCFIPVDKLDVTSLKSFLHDYLTKLEFKQGKIQDKDNYVFIPKD
jgi:hypothetical protein